MNKGEYIRLLLKERKLQVKEIAKLLGIRPNSLSLKLAGKRNFTETQIAKLLEILDMTYEDVFQATQVEIYSDDIVLCTLGNKRYMLPRVTANEIQTMIEERLIG